MYLSRIKRKKVYSIVLLSLFIFLSIATTSVLADGEVKMKIDPGFEGYYKNSGTVPIDITITNNSDEDLQGMVYLLASDYGSKSRYYQNVTVAKNTTKEVTLLVSQTMDRSTLYSNAYVYFEADGKEIAKEQIGGTSLSEDSLLIGVLANDKDTGNFLTTSKSINQYFKTINLTDDNIPSNSNVLSNLDMIIINDYSLDKFNPDQIEAINEWVRKGGLLILGGGPNSQKSITPLSEISPVDVKGYVELDSLSSLEEEIGKSINIEDSLIVSNAEVKNGEVFYHEDSVPLFVYNEVNEGKVLYVAYDLADDLLSTWAGNNQLWKLIFSELDINSLIYDDYRYNNYGLSNAAEKIPSINLPDIKILIIIFVIYIIVVIPLLYFILKRKDKREWNWLFIPIIAVVLTVGIFEYGSLIRDKQVMTHNVSYLELVSDGYGKVQAVSSIYAQSSHDYQVEFEDIDILTPVQYYSSSGASKSLISINADKTNVEYENVEFWGYRSSYIEKTITELGQINSDLKFKDNGIIGTITNETSIDMHDLKIVYDNAVFEIGDFKAGDSIKVDIEDTSTANINSRYYIGEKLIPKELQSSNNYYSTRENDLANVIVDYALNDNNTLIVGWSEDEIIHPEVVGEEQSNESLTIISANIDILPADDGTIYFPKGSFRANIISSNIPIYDRDESFEIPNNSEVEIEFYINKFNLEFEINKVQLYEDNSYYKLNKRVYNWQTEEYDSFDDVFSKNILEGEEINKYVSKDGTLRIECSHDYDEYVYIQKPLISVVGKVVE